MDKKYKLLQELLPLMERFEKEQQGQEVTLEAFVLWLNESWLIEKSNLHTNEGKLSSHEMYNIQLSAMVAYLFRYAKHYSKKALKDSTLTTIDDYVFLATLIQESGMTKSELIQRHLLEITSGTEILKRLLKQGLIEEQENQEDRRSKKLKITPKGMQVLAESQPGMQQAAEIVGGNLSKEEKLRVLQIGNRLKTFHDQIHENDKKSALSTILEKYF